jgi:hypothetical protein
MNTFDVTRISMHSICGESEFLNSLVVRPSSSSYYIIHISYSRLSIIIIHCGGPEPVCSLNEGLLHYKLQSVRILSTLITYLSP